jgi:hypothetical protein
MNIYIFDKRALGFKNIAFNQVRACTPHLAGAAPTQYLTQGRLRQPGVINRMIELIATSEVFPS